MVWLMKHIYLETLLKNIHKQPQFSEKPVAQQKILKERTPEVTPPQLWDWFYVKMAYNLNAKPRFRTLF